jgi:hypothetical protein
VERPRHSLRRHRSRARSARNSARLIAATTAFALRMRQPGHGICARPRRAAAHH